MARKQRVAAVVLSVLLGANLLCGLYVYSASDAGIAEKKAYHAMQQYARVLKIVRHQYVDEKKVDHDKLLHGALNGMLSTLDRFSSFIPPERFTDMNEETEGHFGGIGVILRMDDGKLMVLLPQEGTPGFRAGLKPGDHITAVDGHPLTDGEMQTAIDHIKGPAGTDVVLSVFRKSTDEQFDVTITRELIQLPTVRKVSMLENGVGYLQITQFGRQTGEELLEGLDKLALERMVGLVVDLRNNPGGLLDSAVEISSIFLEPGMLVVSTEGRHAAQRFNHHAGRGRKFVRMPMVILINEGSASAAEILAGCLKDYGRAFLVGEKTFGKGSVQNVIGLDDGSAVRITTAYYYTPSRNVIHEKGIEPNIVVDIPNKDAAQLYRQRNRPKGLPREPEEPEDIEDLQLQQALKFLDGLKDLPANDPAAIADLCYALEIRPVEMPKVRAPGQDPVEKPKK